MNKCTELELQEMLPDLLHGKLDADHRAKVEAHVAACAECTEELHMLRTVKSSAVFVPVIDVDRVARNIPPYRGVAPAREVPARSRAVAWLVAASLVLVVAGGGSVLVQQRQRGQQIVSADSGRLAVPVPDSGMDSLGPAAVTGGVPLQPRVNQRGHALALATSIDALSDYNLRQLMNDMNSFDALPATEPDPAISVDNGDTLDQGSR
jgi:anti-sigma factor RsiW